MYAIHAKDLVREYAPGRGVCGIELAIEPGECFALLGRNGSGKSTLSRLILGLEEVRSGSLTVLGCAIRKGSRKHLARIGVALDTDVHWGELSGRDNAYFVARSYGVRPTEIEGRLDVHFQRAGLSAQARDPVKTYSFGMRRKLSLIQAVCHDPELIVLDEAVRGVDPQFLIGFSDLLRHRCQAGRTVWIAGNDPDWIASLATKVAFMDSGKILAQGTVDELVDGVSPFQKVDIKMEQRTPLRFRGMDGVHSLVQGEDAVTAILDDDPKLIPALMDWIVSQRGVITRVEVSRSTLRDAFLLKTGRTLKG